MCCDLQSVLQTQIIIWIFLHPDSPRTDWPYLDMLISVGLGSLRPLTRSPFWVLILLPKDSKDGAGGDEVALTQGFP